MNVYIVEHMLLLYGTSHVLESHQGLCQLVNCPIYKHFSETSGLFIKDVDENHNMTSYSCLFQIYDRNKVKIIASAIGMLIMLETIIYIRYTDK